MTTKNRGDGEDRGKGKDGNGDWRILFASGEPQHELSDNDRVTAVIERTTRKSKA